MSDPISAPDIPPDQNAVIECQVRPDDLMEELGIKKDAYYAYLKHLDIKAQRDGDGKAYLEPDQADRIRALRSHVQETGRIEGFEETALATAEESGLGSSGAPWSQDSPADSTDPSQLEHLIRQAQELAAHHMAMGDLVVAQLAQQMTFDDLTPELQSKVQGVREATHPKSNPAEIANRIMQQWRSQRGTQAA
ncbi:hypothetical protein GFS31_08580 [Leptolyngbya sp. BL0902]|uniref:hypothetical protein n=1 Tax=Leptolyngbya sp. BL0902 TaxID=1115757 RepID=UPI0018E82303|nr:hypothetical protein [Leptolyngbya sp. BL0902]QQE64179.1 hypothetical protein GFS31_08580 [Leptolyngbya sp. BL0902]